MTLGLKPIRTFNFVLLGAICCACRPDPDFPTGPPAPDDSLPPISDTSSVEGFSILEKLPGIWHGPVTSSTPLGSYSEWIVDFRPISAGQISARNELDSLNNIFMSFFVSKYNGEYLIGFRNGGGFAGQVRNSYMFVDSVFESPAQSFYRFVDPVAGGNRVDTDITFENDSITMHVHTNYYNTLSAPVTHMIWKAQRKDTSSAQTAVNFFDFPQKVLVRDMSSTFDGLTDACFYTAASDPYPEGEQPYLGQAQINISITSPPVVDPAKKVIIIISTQPLFSGWTFVSANLKYRSRYVFIGAAASTGFLFPMMHPGDYYINAIYDENGDFNFSSGDYMNLAFDVPITVNTEELSTQGVTINFLIP